MWPYGASKRKSVGGAYIYILYMYVIEVLQTPGRVGSRDSVQKSFFNMCTRAPKNRFMIPRNSDSGTDERFVLYCDRWALAVLFSRNPTKTRQSRQQTLRKTIVHLLMMLSSFREFISMASVSIQTHCGTPLPR